MRSFLSLASFVLLVIAGCAAEAPDWTRGQPSSFPSAEYLTAVGVSRARDSAKARARLELQETFRRPPDSGGVDANGMRIAEVWHDRELGAYYALAVIDRHSAGKPFSDALFALEQDVGGQVESAEAADSSLLRWAHYQQAASLAAKRGELTADLRRIDPDAEIPAAIYSLSELVKRRNRAAASVGVDIRLRNDRDETVKQGLVQAFAHQGFRLAPDFAADLRIRGSVAAVLQPSGISAVAAWVEVEGGGSDLKLSVIDEEAVSRDLGERLAFRIMAAVTALTDQNPL